MDITMVSPNALAFAVKFANGGSVVVMALCSEEAAILAQAKRIEQGQSWKHITHIGTVD